MLARVLRARLSWLEATPAGQILNRFAGDLGQMDEVLPTLITDLVQTSLMIVGTLVLVGLANPYVLLLLIPLSYFFLKLRARYILASQQIKRLDSISKAPLHSLMSATLDGLMTVRGTPDLSLVFHGRFILAMRSSMRVYAVMTTVVRWFGMRLDLLSASFISATALSAVGLMTAGLVDSVSIGLALTYVLQLLGIFQWCIRLTADIENAMTSVERVHSLTGPAVPVEAAAKVAPLPETRSQLRLQCPGWDESQYPVSSVSASRRGGNGTKRLANAQGHRNTPHSVTINTDANTVIAANGAVANASASSSSVWPPSRGRLDFVRATLRYLPPPHPAGLDQVTVSIPAGAKVGIVGRTGSGKSTLLNALFRLVELDGFEYPPDPAAAANASGAAIPDLSMGSAGANGGKNAAGAAVSAVGNASLAAQMDAADRGALLIDGVDVSTVGLDDLRRALAVIPQEPTLFSGTIRSNLDPFGECDDATLVTALKHAQLYDAFFDSNNNDGSSSSSSSSGVHLLTSGLTSLVSPRPAPAAPNGNKSAATSGAAGGKYEKRGLETPVADGGSNLSIGQRQLLCLARALARPAPPGTNSTPASSFEAAPAGPRILVLDEATANVDYATDALVQRVVREQFADRTVIVVAHRIATVIDSDLIIVMDKGCVAQVGAPWELLTRQPDGLFAKIVDSAGAHALRGLARDAYARKHGDDATAALANALPAAHNGGSGNGKSNGAAASANNNSSSSNNHGNSQNGGSVRGVGAGVTLGRYQYKPSSDTGAAAKRA